MCKGGGQMGMDGQTDVHSATGWTGKWQAPAPHSGEDAQLGVPPLLALKSGMHTIIITLSIRATRYDTPAKARDADAGHRLCWLWVSKQPGAKNTSPAVLNMRMSTI